MDCMHCLGCLIADSIYIGGNIFEEYLQFNTVKIPSDKEIKINLNEKERAGGHLRSIDRQIIIKAVHLLLLVLYTDIRWVRVLLDPSDLHDDADPSQLLLSAQNLACFFGDNLRAGQPAFRPEDRKSVV